MRMNAGMSRFSALIGLAGLLALSGCASMMGASGHMSNSLNYVRQHKGEGLRQTLEGTEASLIALAETSMRNANYTVMIEPNALLAKATQVDLAYAFYFYPSQTPGHTDVEILIASPWLKADQMAGFQRQQFVALTMVPRSQVAAPAPAAASVSPAFVSEVDRFGRREKERPDDFALIIGIEKYETLPKADYGERDAQTFRSYVLGLGVPEENVISLSGAKATKTGITKYLEEWLPRNVTADSRVYFYYSGHGAPDAATGAAYLVPYDGDPSFLQSSAYPLPRLYEKLQALKAKEIIVALDSCFSGAGGRSVIAKGARPLMTTVAASAVGPKVSVLAASDSAEISGSIDEQGHGMFTYFLLKGLKGEADADGDSHVTLGELYGYLHKGVQRAARRQNREQTPQLQSTQPDLKLY